MVTAGCGSSGGSQGGDSGGTLKIGLLNTMTGPFAQFGKDGLIGAKLAVDEINKGGGVNGKKLELVVKDEQLSATVTVQAMREFATAGIHIVVGFDSSADCLAAEPVAKQYNMVIIAPTCSADEVTGAKFNERLFAVSGNTSMFGKASAIFAAEHFKDVKTWDNLTFDYITGHSYWDGFQAAMKAAGAPVSFGKSVFAPLTTTQWSTYITAMSSAGGATPKGLFSYMFPASIVSMLQQAKPYNFVGKYKYLLFAGAYEQVAASLGAESPDAYYIYDYYYDSFHNAVNDAFVKAFQASQPSAPFYGPDAITYQNYTALLAVKAAVKAAGSDLGDKIIKALPGKHFQSPKGDVFFRTDHLLAAPVAAFECVGDASAAKHYKCPLATSIPADSVLPPITSGG
jgi:branched-chain amino acid transport system substrate-binding protein